MFVALEGIDGAGKNTLAQGLQARARGAGLGARRLSFPRYDETAFGGLVGRYLNGAFGGLDQVSPYFSALLYAGDRYESRDDIAAALAASDLLIADRYCASNIAYNAAKLDPAERAEFIAHFDDIEHRAFGLPRPDLYVLLAIPPAIAATLVARKATRGYTDKAADLHEENRDYLTRCDAVYRQLAREQSGAPWQVVDIVDGGENLRPAEAIADEVWAALAAGLGQD